MKEGVKKERKKGRSGGGRGPEVRGGGVFLPLMRGVKGAGEIRAGRQQRGRREPDKIARDGEPCSGGEGSRRRRRKKKKEKKER